jgi:hypothetical protein
MLLYFGTGRPSFEMPERFSIVTSLPNNTYESELNRLIMDGKREKIDLVLFHTSWAGGPFATTAELQQRGFRPVLHSAKGNYILVSMGTGETHERVKFPLGCTAVYKLVHNYAVAFIAVRAKILCR